MKTQMISVFGSGLRNPVLPLELASESKGIRQRIVEELAGNQPVSARQLYNKISNGASRVTYQGVHKAVVQLTRESVLSKGGDGYSISSEWVSALQEFCSRASSNLAGHVLPPLSQSVYFLDSMYKTDLFLFDFVEKIYSPADKVMALNWFHFWMPYFFFDKEYVRSKELVGAADVYSISPASTAPDLWCKSYWDKNGLKNALGVDTRLMGDVVAYRDFFIQVLYPQELRKSIDELYESAPDAKSFDTEKFLEIACGNKYKIPVVITRNEQLANQIKSEIIRAYRQKLKERGN